MAKITSRRSQPLPDQETNERLLDSYNIDIPSDPAFPEDDGQQVFEYYNEDWVISGLRRSMLTWHFDPPADPQFGDACLSLNDETVEIYTGTRWVRMTLLALAHCDRMS